MHLDSQRPEVHLWPKDCSLGHVAGDHRELGGHWFEDFDDYIGMNAGALRGERKGAEAYPWSLVCVLAHVSLFCTPTVQQLLKDSQDSAVTL